MISEGHVYVTEPGDTVSLECNFHADQYDSFEYPVLWRKRQHLEDSQVNVMGTLMEPFYQRNRFEVTFHASNSRYRLMLHIRGMLRLSRPLCASRFLPREAMLARYMLWPCVCQCLFSVCLSVQHKSVF